ncbi:LodA/GoxA family CTQ-dependent oxidase [Chloroflexi bacterium TSY]|nr:LodA/GoxA family CTQ-dependent oxidase [Chloroflexi bacterium TSY]
MNHPKTPGQENQLVSDVLNEDNPNYRPRLMPLLCGNNPLTNTVPQKFLRLTDTQLFLLKQWAAGKFVNECQEWGEADENCKTPFKAPPKTGLELDRGVLGNVVGGAFCPGAELSWNVLNPANFYEPYRIKHATYQVGALSLPKVIADQDHSPASDLSEGLEPGDLTKYLGLPWQSDFTQCALQPVDVTYENWNDIYLDSVGDPAKEQTVYLIWWPAHRPLVVNNGLKGPDGKPSGKAPVYWDSGVPQNNAGGLRMVTAWKDLGFIKYFSDPKWGFIQVERNDQALGPSVSPGDLLLGNTKEGA